MHNETKEVFKTLILNIKQFDMNIKSHNDIHQISAEIERFKKILDKRHNEMCFVELQARRGF